MSRGNVRFDQLSILVLDEADRMLDMGFMPDIRRIVGKLPVDRQTLMFSATFAKEIERFASEMQRDPVRVEAGTIAAPVDTVRQGIYTVEQGTKRELLSELLRDSEVESALVFLRTKHRTDRVTKALHKEGFKVQAIHGGRSQRQRQQALDGFRDGRYKILVATDVASRGLDIQGISHVINFDIPQDSDGYIHRIGRTARANAKGNALTFVCPDEHMELRTIETALGSKLPREPWRGSVPIASAPEPARRNAPKPKRFGPQRRRRIA
jgi:ATP-dependent RNA helicase RhlE